MRWSHAGLAAACCAAVLTAGCSGADAGAREDVREDARDDARLPAGVIPPSGAAVPGQAELGPDGLYDYAGVPDFVPANPCEGEWRAAASAAGYEHRELDIITVQTPGRPNCMLSKEDGTTILLTGDANGRAEYAALGYPIEEHVTDEFSWYTVVVPTYDDDGYCQAMIDTPTGGIGVPKLFSPDLSDSSEGSACAEASERFLEIRRNRK